MTPTLTRVVRLDSLPLNQTYFTDEGYLIDRPILTSTGIFEYKNPDGGIRRELRLPEEVFDPESLKSYKGKPIIITHSAGLVTKDNVERHCIGTVLTEGYRSGEDVRAEIVIHDTDGMKVSGLRELSLGYDLDLDETPGEWNGEPYDAIQRNIRVNHLALVGEARAGKQARLNIDGRDQEKNILTGGKSNMSKAKTHNDGVLSQDELAEAIAQYKAKRAEMLKTKEDGEQGTEPVKSTEPEITVTDSNDVPEDDIEAKLELVKENRTRRDQEGDPESTEAAKDIISRQDGDMDTLFDIIDTLLAEKDFNAAGNKDSAEETEGEPVVEEPDVTDGDEPVGEGEVATDYSNEDGEDEEEVKPVVETMKADCGKATPISKTGKTVNIDAADIQEMIRERVKLGMLGKQLNLDGIEDMNVRKAKEAIIGAIRPGMRFDGKSDAYVSAAFDMAVSDMRAKTAKGTGYQKRQMFNKDSVNEVGAVKGRSAADARREMIERQRGKKEDK